MSFKKIYMFLNYLRLLNRSLNACLSFIIFGNPPTFENRLFYAELRLFNFFECRPQQNEY